MENVHRRSESLSAHRVYQVALKEFLQFPRASTTDLAYFLEVELRQSMEPVSQLSKVEELHLKPEIDKNI